VVPAAILFDLLNGGEKDWGETPPYRALGRAALDAVAAEFALGNSGAGFGAKAGALKGGLGSASAIDDDGLQVGALVAANPRGSAVVPGADCLWAWPFERAGELGQQVPPAGPLPEDEDPGAAPPAALDAGGNTTIGIVATNAALDRAEARRLAIMAQDGYARAIRPAHTPFDGDTIFALATGRMPLPEPRAASLARLGAAAADCVARAVGRGIYEAAALGPWPAYRERHRAGFRAGPPAPERAPPRPR